MDNLEDFRILFSIKHGHNTVNSWIDVHQNLEKNISKDYLPFGSDVSDNPLCLNVKQGDENYGKVYIIYFDCGSIEPTLMVNSLEELFGVKSIDEL